MGTIFCDSKKRTMQLLRWVRTTATMKFSLILLFFFISVAYTCSPMADGDVRKRYANPESKGKTFNKSGQPPENRQ
uniref:Transmembrane protein n=1 Tax=Steinernema glaseri TaxID=37863 RepID=A0A1I8AML0_9BILA